MTLPAPDPMLRTSTSGMVRDSPHSTAHRSVRGIPPSRMQATSVLVPPTSMVSRFGYGLVLATRRAADTPPVGPDCTWNTALRFAEGLDAAVHHHDPDRTGEPPVPQRRPEPLQVPADHSADVGVDDHGGGPFVLPGDRVHGRRLDVQVGV